MTWCLDDVNMNFQMNRSHACAATAGPHLEVQQVWLYILVKLEFYTEELILVGSKFGNKYNIK